MGKYQKFQEISERICLKCVKLAAFYSWNWRGKLCWFLQTFQSSNVLDARKIAQRIHELPELIKKISPKNLRVSQIFQEKLLPKKFIFILVFQYRTNNFLYLRTPNILETLFSSWEKDSYDSSPLTLKSIRDTSSAKKMMKKFVFCSSLVLARILPANTELP